MDRTERFYRIEQLLRTRGLVRLTEFLEALSVSRATFKRDLEYLRDRMDAPIEWNRDKGGYELLDEGRRGTWQLPGLWFNAAEIHALLMLEHLLGTLQPSLLAKQIAPLRERVRKLLESAEFEAADIRRRMRVLPMAERASDPRLFETIATATLARRRVSIRHYNRRADQHLERIISPQRLVHYRYNWYVEAWCHLRSALRVFAIDAMEAATMSEERAREVPDAELDRRLNAGFGIFYGDATHTAVLRFAPLRARWVSRERWHPQQKGTLQADGSYVLELPYGDERELLMEILKYGPDVRVLAPERLAQSVARALRAGAAQYAEPERRESRASA